MMMMMMMMIEVFKKKNYQKILNLMLRKEILQTV